ncbi:hypothetical protein ACFL20_10240 [Spirochaetota bacterium]
MKINFTKINILSVLILFVACSGSNVNTNLNNWNNKLARQKYGEVARNICNHHNPVYLGLGIEVNTYYAKNPEDFDRFVEFYKKLYDEIKSAGNCTETMIFVTFQLEQLKGLGTGVGFSGISQWDVFEKFDGKLDLLVFTSYPEFEYIKPADIPQNYYDVIYDNLPLNLRDKKIGISEFGWNSRQNLIPDANNSVDTQADFITRFAEITDELNSTGKLEFAVWIFMHDFQIGDFMVGSSFGLIEQNGTHKDYLPGYTIMDHFLQLKHFQGYKVGVAPIPRNFPEANETDWTNLYSIIDGTFDIMTAQQHWYDSTVEPGEIPQAFQDF